MPDLTRRAATLEATAAVSDLAVKELVSPELAEVSEALAALQGWLDFRSSDGLIHFANARDGLVGSLERAKRAVKEAESSLELQSQRVRTAKAEQGAERTRLAALEAKLHALTADFATLAAASGSSLMQPPRGALALQSRFLPVQVFFLFLSFFSSSLNSFTLQTCLCFSTSLVFFNFT